MKRREFFKRTVGGVAILGVPVVAWGQQTGEREHVEETKPPGDRLVFYGQLLDPRGPLGEPFPIPVRTNGDGVYWAVTRFVTVPTAGIPVGTPVVGMTIRWPGTGLLVRPQIRSFEITGGIVTMEWLDQPVVQIHGSV